jgi:hypothetical protein
MVNLNHIFILKGNQNLLLISDLSGIAGPAPNLEIVKNAV